MIDRAFVRAPAGLIHLRTAGEDRGVPVLMAHGGPGSSTSLVPLISALSQSRRVIAPDMLGHGESDPPTGETSIAFYAECLRDLLDRMGIQQVDAYGHHTGAQVVAALAVSAPGRVRRLVLDGVALFTAQERAEYLRLYAPPLVPDADGAHVDWIWRFNAQLTRHFPYYRTDDAHELRPIVTRAPEVLTDACADMLNGWRTYHLAYHAAFRDDVGARLFDIRQPTLVLCTTGDPLAIYAERAAALLAEGSLVTVERADKSSAIAAFCQIL